MPKLILQSACVGFASVIVAAFVVGFIALSLSAMSTPSPDTGNEAGWDVLAVVKGVPLWVWLFPLAFFAIGFLIGFRYFSKRQAKQGA
jgi:hypothetical protein